VAARKKKSARQARFLFSKGSPLSKKQKEKMASEIRTGAVRIKGGKKALGRKSKDKRRKR
jgi:hypothetical protein